MSDIQDGHKGSYDRGVEQGKVLERLEGHDEHFRRINGSIDRSTERLASLEMTMDQLVNLITNSSATFTASESRKVESETAQQSSAQKPSRAILLFGAVTIALLAVLVLLEIL
jgi:hypothetical protein